VLLYNVFSDSSLMIKKKLLIFQHETHYLQDKPLLKTFVLFYSQHLNFIHIKTVTPLDSHVSIILAGTNTIHTSIRLTMDGIFFQLYVKC